MTLVPTLALAAVFGALAAFAGWRDARPPSHKPRLVPWRLAYFLAGAGAIFMTVHLAALLGFSIRPAPPAP